MTNEQDLLTMENVELQIWEITEEPFEVATRLEACRFLIEWIEAEAREAKDAKKDTGK